MNYGNCVVDGYFGPRKYEMNVTTLQASILNLFNFTQSLTFNQLQTESMLERDMLKKVLQTLSNPKYMILLKTGDKTALND